MSKFSSSTKTQTLSPVKSVAPATTHEGGQGFSRDPKSELFLLAITNMVQEQTFYEGAKDRDERFRFLIHEVTAQDPEWVQRFVPYLRNTMQMRSASIVMAAEYVKAVGPNGRQVINSAISRADEPAEMLGYWTQTHGKTIPKPVKRGVADAVVRLYNERNALKYDGQSKAWRMGDVVELTHPKPNGNSDLLYYLLEVRHHPDSVNLPESLTLIRKARELDALPVEERRSRLKEAGEVMGWERLSGWLQGPMDAQAWEAVIPQMGYMALLRNLRNFDQAEISKEAQTYIIGKLSDPEEVAKSRQFPLRFISAWKSVTSMTWGPAIEQALEHSVRNVPALGGRTLVMIDVSGSMNGSYSERGTALAWESAATFGIALAKAAEKPDVVLFRDQVIQLDIPKGVSVLRAVEQVRPYVGGGTYTMQALEQSYQGHDRVVILTDEQAHDGGDIGVPVPIYTFNLAGYRVGHLPSGRDDRHTFGGLTDAGFRAIEILESHRHGEWPF